jgi:uncharacterized protein
MNSLWLVALGVASGAGAGLLAGLVGIGGGVVVVPVVYYGLVGTGFPADQAAHVAVGTSLAAIMPAAVVSSLGHWRAGNTDFNFLREWGPGIALGVVTAQLAAPYLHGSLLTGVFAVFCLVGAGRFAAPGRFRPIFAEPPRGRFCHIAGAGIGLISGFAGVGGGILTNIVMTVCGMSMHKSIGRAAAVGMVISAPATIVAALGPSLQAPGQLGSINLAMWVCIAPAQAVGAWIGAQLAQTASAVALSRIFAITLAATGAVMLRSSLP